jgi:hypothetical protein
LQEYNICFTTVERSTDGSFPRLPSSKTTGVLPEPPFASQNVEVVDLGVRSDSLISSLKLDRQKDSKFAPLPGQLLRKYIADGATYYVIN